MADYGATFLFENRKNWPNPVVAEAKSQCREPTNLRTSKLEE
jgi:hypothetical protein